MQEQILKVLLEQEDISWKSIIMDLVTSEQMDPWDVNISLLTQKYLEVIRRLQEHDLKISGKILLAAALLLRVKSTYLLENDFTHFDSLLQATEEGEEELLGELQETGKKERQKFQLIPRNPQSRNRKVSLQDLIQALEQAMASRKRLLARIKPVQFVLPKGKIDISEVIRDLYYKIKYYAEKNGEELTFSKLLPPRAGRQEKVYTFIPLLHLEHERKIETSQQAPFSEIQVKLLKHTAQ